MKANIETRSYIGLLHTLQGIALLFLKQGRTESAVEVYELSRTQPFVANSVWFEWAVGRPIDSAAGSMPPELLAEARRQGKARDLWGTAAELLEYLNKSAGPDHLRPGGIGPRRRRRDRRHCLQAIKVSSLRRYHRE